MNGCVEKINKFKYRWGGFCNSEIRLLIIHMFAIRRPSAASAAACAVTRRRLTTTMTVHGSDEP